MTNPTNNPATETTANPTHKFELAGLGKAPFRVVRVTVKRGPINLGNGLTVGAPGQPMGSCAYCGQGITECWEIKSADGNTFDVGCVCVEKTGDKGLIRQLEPGKAKLRRAKTKARKARETERINDAFELVEKDGAVRSALAGTKAPAGAYSTNALEYVEWMRDNAGHSGKLKCARLIEKLDAAKRDEKGGK